MGRHRQKATTAGGATPQVATRRLIVWLAVATLLVMAWAAQWPELGAAVRRSLATSGLLRALLPSNAPAGTPEIAAPVGAQARALAMLAERSGQPAAAEGYLSAALAHDPQDELTRFELCRFYAEAGRWEEAGRTCAGSLTSVEYWLQTGVKATDARDLISAIQWFRLATITDPGHSEAWHFLARAHLNAGEYAAAIPAYERVLALDEGRPFDVFNALGTAYLEVGNAALAQATAERGLLIYPNRRELYLIVGESLVRQEQFDAAERWYRQWLQQWPNDAFAWSQRGELAMRRERPFDAITYFQQATVVEPETAGYWMNLGMAAAAAGNGTLATAAYDKALALRPDDADMWLRAGRSLRQMDETERARAVFEHVLVLQPGNSEATTELAGLDTGATTP